MPLSLLFSEIQAITSPYQWFRRREASSVGWFYRFHQLENFLLAQELYEDPTEAIQEQQLRAQAIDALEAARAALFALPNRKVDVATQMEEDLDLSSRPSRSPRSPPRRRSLRRKSRRVLDSNDDPATSPKAVPRIGLTVVPNAHTKVKRYSFAQRRSRV
jgi:hypothetical protein